jgi:KAP family P-loop domain
MADSEIRTVANAENEPSTLLSVNDAARGVLADYMKRTSPGYAILIDAPWGAGKTYFIRNETGCETNSERLYVSLYGVSTSEEFDWALVRAVMPFTEGNIAKYGKIVAKALSALSLGPVSFDLSKVSLTEIVLSKLPETLIFDDLERCRIEHDELFGLLNRFVEHQGKRVILVANTLEHPEIGDFRKKSEKLIGRKVSIEADPVAAIASFWKDMPEGPGKQFLKERQDISIAVFKDAKHDNLRLFRQSLMDAARFIDAIENDIRANVTPMEGLLRTFLALSMALAGGEIAFKDLAKRGDYHLFSKSDKTETTSALKDIQDRHADCDIQGYHNSIFPVDLGIELIGRGFAIADDINRWLRGTYQFSKKAETPDWIRLWNWYDEPESELVILLEKITAALKNDEITLPGELLQIFGAMKFMREIRALSGNVDGLAKQFIALIKRLSKKGLLQPYEPRSSTRDGFGYSVSSGTVSYGGYAFQLDDFTIPVVEAMQKAQKFGLEQLLPGESSELLGKLRSDPYEFIAMFEYQSKGRSFSQTPILHHIAPHEFALAVLELFRTNRAQAKAVCEKLKERGRLHNSELAAEHDWYDRMVAEIRRLAARQSRLYAGQLELFVRWNLDIEEV